MLALEAFRPPVDPPAGPAGFRKGVGDGDVDAAPWGVSRYAIDAPKLGCEWLDPLAEAEPGVEFGVDRKPLLLLLLLLAFSTSTEARLL